MSNPEITFTVTESPEGGYEARSLGYAIFTHADSMAELTDEIRQAVCCHFDCGAAPVTIRLEGAHNVVINA